MKRLRTNKRKTVGIDISEGSTQIVQIGHQAKYTSLDAYTSFTEDPLRSSQYQKALMESLEDPTYGAIDTNNAVVALPTDVTQEFIFAPSALSRSSSQTTIEQFVRQNTKWQNYLWYYYPLSTDLYGIVVIDKNYHQQLLDILGNTHLKLQKIKPRNLLYFRHTQRIPASSLIIDIGFASTVFAITLSDTFLISELSFGLKDILKTLEYELGISQQQALYILSHSGYGDTELGYKLKSITHEPLQVLINAINELLDTYYDHCKPSEINIILNGQFATTKGLDEYLSAHVAAKPQSINPWIDENTYPLKPMPHKRWAQYAHAIDLALSR